MLTKGKKGNKNPQRNNLLSFKQGKELYVYFKISYYDYFRENGWERQEWR